LTIYPLDLSGEGELLNSLVYHKRGCLKECGSLICTGYFQVVRFVTKISKQLMTKTYHRHGVGVLIFFLEIKKKKTCRISMKFTRYEEIPKEQYGIAAGQLMRDVYC